MPRPRHLLLAAFAALHAAFLLAQIIPPTLRPSLPTPGIGTAYRTLTGCPQRWNMFETIPVFHRVDASIEVLHADGTTGALGPLLPGLTPLTEGTSPRVLALFDRMLWGGAFTPARDAYLEKIDAQLRAGDHLAAGDSWVLRYDLEFTRELARIRQDGTIALPQVATFAPPASPPPLP